MAGQPKVFCIGFQKTGTSSMGKALKQLGYRVTGPNGVNDPAIPKKVYREAERLTREFDAFQDNPWPIIWRWCYEHYPDARFILTVRDPERWYTSALNGFGAKSSYMREWVYGATRGSPVGNKDIWLLHYNRHNAEVLEFFKDKPNFIVMDITKGDGWEKLCAFLGKPVPDAPFPHANPARERLPKKVFFLKRWKRQVFGRKMW